MISQTILIFSVANVTLKLNVKGVGWVWRAVHLKMMYHLLAFVLTSNHKHTYTHTHTQTQTQTQTHTHKHNHKHKHTHTHTHRLCLKCVSENARIFPVRYRVTFLLCFFVRSFLVSLFRRNKPRLVFVWFLFLFVLFCFIFLSFLWL